MNFILKYKPEYDEIAGMIRRLGGTYKDIADALDIDEDTVPKWIVSYPSFGEAVKENERIANAKVAGALFKRALGYSYTESEIRTEATADGKEKTSKKIVKKELPPDVVACIFFLKNREPLKWKDVNLVDSGENITSILNKAYEKARQSNDDRPK